MKNFETVITESKGKFLHEVKLDGKTLVKRNSVKTFSHVFFVHNIETGAWGAIGFSNNVDTLKARVAYYKEKGLETYVIAF